MREILFRGKRANNGEWVEGGITFFIDGTPYICPTRFSDYDDEIQVLLETVGQFTDLKDKHDKKIFEGDILKVRSIRTETLCVVVFREGWFIGVTEDNGECEFRYMVDVEIVGNIHDNPDLITIKPLEGD